MSQATVGTQGYTIGVNASYIPQPGGITAVASGSIGLGAPAAFCTSQQPYAISSSTYDAYEFPAVTDPLSGFNRIGGSGLDAGINGAAVAPVCGF